MFEGHADWARIAELKSQVSIPVIGSGDLFSAADVAAMLAETGCDGVMVARGALGAPWIFREALDLLAGREPVGPTPLERLDVARRHLEMFADLAGEAVALREMKKHLSWYSKGLPGASRFRDLVNRTDGREETLAALETFFREGQP